MDQNRFHVTHVRIGKPTSKRRYYLYRDTYENAMYHFLNEFSYSVYGCEYWYEMLGTCVIIKRIHADKYGCEYSLKFYETDRRKKLLEEWKMEIELEMDTKKYDILYQELDFEPKKITKEKVVVHNKWFKQETYGMQTFLRALSRVNDINELKENYSRHQFWRYKKRCEENGYIDEFGKLKKRISYSKYE